MARWYETMCYDRWDDFVKALGSLEGAFYYRGQSDRDYELKSLFDRAYEVSQHNRKVGERWKYEAAILREFKRRSYHYVVDTPDKDDLLEWLALMRHYGAPTRLLDFTYSYYIAAYFAFSELGNKDRAVWAIKQEWLGRESDGYLSAYGVDTNIDMHIPEHFTKCMLDPDRKTDSSRCFVRAVNPERMNTRLTIQQGLFLCPGDIEQPFEKNLERMVLKSKDSTQGVVLKFIIPHEERTKAITELKCMNISNSTLFPDLGGLSRSLNDRFEYLFKGDYQITDEVLKRAVTWPESNTKS